MIVRISSSPAELLDANDFKHFKVVAGPSAAAANSELVTFETPERAWVNVEALRKLSGVADADWNNQLDAMIEKARPYGWIADEPLRIAAHVERED